MGSYRYTYDQTGRSAYGQVEPIKATPKLTGERPKSAPAPTAAFGAY